MLLNGGQLAHVAINAAASQLDGLAKVKLVAKSNKPSRVLQSLR